MWRATLFGFVAAADLLDGEDVMHVRCLVDAENLEPRAAFVGVGKDDRGHGRHLLRESTDGLICTALPGLWFADCGPKS